MAGKIFQLTTQGSSLGQMVLNRYHFYDADGVGDPLVLCADFRDHVLNTLTPALAAGFSFDGLLYQQVWPTVQVQRLYTTGFPLHGAVAGGQRESYVAASIRWAFGDSVILTPEVPQRHVRRGGKRLAGIPDSWTHDNIIADGRLITACNNYIAALVALPPDGWQFVICGFPKTVPDPDPTTPVPQPAPNKYALVNGGALNIYLGSQVSRKHGHGR